MTMQNTAGALRANPDATLTSLAYINVTWNESKASYLDNFMPYALEALRVAGTPQTAAQISRVISDQFGLSFPVQVTKALIDRAVRHQEGFAHRPITTGCPCAWSRGRTSRHRTGTG